MVVQRWRERTSAVGGELKLFGRKGTDTSKDIFILPKHINNGSQLEPMLIKKYQQRLLTRTIVGESFISNSL
jgi:hypothetical protein